MGRDLKVKIIEANNVFHIYIKGHDPLLDDSGGGARGPSRSIKGKDIRD